MKLKNYLLFLTLSISGFVFAQTGTDISGSFMSGDSLRKYLIYVPNIYHTMNVPVPLIVNMHGAGGTSASQQTTEDFRKIADTANFIVVHPQGLDIPLEPEFPTFKSTAWNVLGTLASWQTDRDFIISLIDSIESHYLIDTSRVYAAGYSEGGFMTYEFACFVPGRFAAIASACGSLIPSHYSTCITSEHQQAIPVMEIHGTSDPVIGYNGTSGITASTDVDTMIRYWVNYNHCNPVPNSITHLSDIVDSCCLGDTVKVTDTVSHLDSLGVIIPVGDTINFVDASKVVHYLYTGGTKGATVEFYKVLNGGHTVPAEPPAPTGKPNEDFTAAKEIWRFFSQYNLHSLGVPIATGLPPLTVPIATGINNETVDNNTISIYPNPSNGLFTLYVENYENTSIQIFNQLGIVVYDENTSGKYTSINLKNLSKGIYLYKVSNKNGFVKSGKLIVQ